jgi:hypothetical protein
MQPPVAKEEIEKRADVWAWYKVGKTYNEIGRLTELTKWTVAKRCGVVPAAQHM